VSGAPLDRAEPAAATARFATAQEREGWDALLSANPGGGEVWMSDAYLGVKHRENGYRDHRVVVDRPGRAPVAVGVLAKRAPLLGEWWHLPAGPAGEDEASVLEVAAAVAAFAKDRGAFLLKIEPRLGPESRAAIRAAGYLDVVRITPNPSTVLVDVGVHGAAAPGSAEAEAELFARLGKKARNAINRARRDGIEVSPAPASEENCRALFALLRETAEGRFVLRRESYYRDFWQSFESAGVGQIFLAHREGQLIAGAFAMALGEKTTYKDGASVRAKSAYGASHALQWEVLRWASERGARVHDLCGAPPSDRIEETGHPLHGVGQFKRSFQPVVTDYAGAFDLPLRPGAYAFWVKLGDRLMRRWSLLVRRDPYY